jgi:beta-lactamase regulating signal transducer with metallopeptidase domain
MLSFPNMDGLTALGWSLLNSIWQMGLLWLVYLLLTANHQRFSAAIRHNLAVMLSLLGCCWFLYSLISDLAFPGGMMHWGPAMAFTTGIAEAVNPFLTTLSVLYLVMLFYQTFRYVQGYHRLRNKKKHGGRMFSEPLQSFADRVSPVMGIGRPVNILLADWVDTAQTIGFIKPMILLPVALVNRLSVEQVEAILLHELQHIRRHDYFINILMTIFRTVFFFNPFAILFFKMVSKEREHACDDEVLLWSYPAPVYAEALLLLEKFRQLPHTLSIAADGNSPRLLMERIRRLVGLPALGKKTFSPLLSFSLIAALFIFMMNSFSRFNAPVKKAPGSWTRVIFQNNTSFISAVSAGEETAGTETARTIRITFQPKELVKDEVVVRQFKAGHAPSPRQENPVVMTVLPGLLEMDEAGPGSPLHYADRYEVRNFSIDNITQPETASDPDLEGAPYIPSSSFAVSPVADTLIPDLLLQNKILALEALAKIRAEELKSKLNAEVDLQSKKLQQFEKENQELIRKKQKELQPAIRMIIKDIQGRKEAIDVLMKQVQVLNGEIIII